MSLTLNNGGDTIWGTEPIGDEDFFYTWIICAGIMRTWELVDVLISTNNHNKKLYKSIYGEEPPPISFKLQPTYKGANLTMSYSFK